MPFESDKREIFEFGTICKFESCLNHMVRWRNNRRYIVILVEGTSMLLNDMFCVGVTPTLTTTKEDGFNIVSANALNPSVEIVL